MWRNLRKPVLAISISSPRGFTVSKTRGPSYRIGASTSMRWPERWETSLSAPLFEQTNPQRPAAHLVAAPEIGFFLNDSFAPHCRRMSRNRVSSCGGCWLRDHGRKVGGRQYRHSPACQYLATGAMLITLIFTFGPISGTHFNPAVKAE